MSEPRKCFVIMPIRKEGSPEYKHFRALYDITIRPTLEQAGFHVERGDDVVKGGSIQKQVVERLAEADLVVADMTDLNPNVFWELGVRHALRGSGTFTLIDHERTESGEPFDLQVYRTIRYSGSLEGQGKLRDELTKFAQNLDDDPGGNLDSPVHGFLPSLPYNVIAVAAGSAEAELRGELAKLKEKLQEYERRFGAIDGAKHSSVTDRPADIIRDALQELEDGNDPSHLLSEAQAAAEEKDKKKFLTVIQRVVDRPATNVDPDFFLRLAAISDLFGREEVTHAILDHACKGHPTHVRLRRSRLSTLAHSHSTTQREIARQELCIEIGIDLSGDEIKVPKSMDAESAKLLGIMLDANLRDSRNVEVLRITKAVVAKFPDMAVILRNHARALELNGQRDEALEFYRQALFAPDADIEAANWLGNTLHNAERRVDALEVYLLACMREPGYSTGFSHVADEISLIMRDREMPYRKDTRPSPDFLNQDTLVRALVATASCDIIRQDDIQRCTDAARRHEIEFARIASMIRAGHAVPASDGHNYERMGIGERVHMAREWHERIKGELTTPPTDGPVANAVAANN